MAQSLSTYIHSPKKIDEQSVNYLKEVLEEHPYCQTVQLLYLKGLQNQSSFQYNNRLRVTAAYAGNRSVLFDYITEPLSADIPEPKKIQPVISVVKKEVSVKKVEEKKTEPQKPTLVASVDSEQVKPFPKQTEETVVKKEEPKEYKPDFSKSKDKSLLSAYEKAQLLIDEQKAKLQQLKQASEPSKEEKIEFKAKEEVSVKEEVKPVESQENLKPNPTIEPIFAVDATTITERQETDEVEEITEAEKRLDIGKPLQFDRDEMHSFTEWLQLSKIKPIERVVEDKTPDDKPIKREPKKRNFDLIDKFIDEQPTLKPKKKDFYSPVNMARISVQADESLVTETLARVYIEQGHYGKAIKTLEILRLKYPEKSSFFADQISAVKNLIKNKNK